MDEIARFCTTADLAASVAFRQGLWHKQLTSKEVREALFQTLVMADLRSQRWMDTFDGYRAAYELLLQREDVGEVFLMCWWEMHVYGAMKGELVEIMAKQNDLDKNGPWKEEFFLLG